MTIPNFNLFLSSLSPILLPSSDCDCSEIFTESPSPPKSSCNQKSISEEERYGFFKWSADNGGVWLRDKAKEYCCGILAEH